MAPELSYITRITLTNPILGRFGPAQDQQLQNLIVQVYNISDTEIVHVLILRHQQLLVNPISETY